MHRNNPPPAILFDIDGTLLYARGIGRAAFGTAFERAYGVRHPDLSKLSFVGATDYNVVRSMAIDCGVPTTPAREEHFFAALAQALDVALDGADLLIYPGVPELLAGLVARGHPLGLITGNVRANAWSKVRHAGLDHFFTFGAYGDEHSHRNEIARLALSRAPATQPARLLVGDTVLDVLAAQANQLSSLAVATGWIPADELTAAGADRVLLDFSDTTATLAAIDSLLAD